MKHPSGADHWTQRTPGKVLRGTSAPGAKLNEAQIAEVHELHAAGHNKTEIARMLGVARITIWRHLREA